MNGAWRTLLLLLAFFFLATALPAVAQQVIATIPIGGTIGHSVVNAASNKVYVITGTKLDVIDGASNTVIAVVQLGSSPGRMWPNEVTNKLYIADVIDNTVTVVNGATYMIDAVISLGAGTLPVALDGNPVTDKVYVAAYHRKSVSVIDGKTNQVTATVHVGNYPSSTAVNSITDKIYVTNQLDGTVSVIDGKTDTETATVTVGQGPGIVLVNTVTNKAYVGNFGDAMGHNVSVSVIDGFTHMVTPVPISSVFGSMDSDQVSNKISLTTANNTVTIIDGDTLTLTTLNVGNNPADAASDAVTNKLYVMNRGDNTVTVIDFANDSQTVVPVGMGPEGAVVNAVANRIYVSNGTDSTISVIGDGNSDPVQFVSVTPCRLLDTRPQSGGTGPIPGGTAQAFNLRQLAQSKGCADLSSAAAFSLNVTLVPVNGAPVGYLTIWPTGEDQPLASNMNSLDGRIKADAAIVPAGYHGEVTVYVSNTSNLLLDIDGYFAPAGGSTLQFYSLTPCRVADTRSSNFPAGLGMPHLSAGVERDFPVLSSTCGIPNTAQAYSLNFTAVPYPKLGYPLGYLKVWPTGESEPMVSTLNNPTGTYVANAAIVAMGTNGAIAALASNDTDLVIDVNGYFAPAGAGGLSLYTGASCRVIDTRKVGNGQPFSGLLNPPVVVVDSPCGVPSAAQSYVFNATVVPTGSLGYLTLWPDGEPQPVVSTLNAADGWITSNMAIVATDNGKIDAYASGLTQLILDISSFFAP